MYEIIITLDYELPVGGVSDVNKYMINPTENILNLFNEFNAKLTIMVDIAEVWAFEDKINEGFSNYLGYDPAILIKNQLTKAIKSGHDVQLHLHPQWLGAKWYQGKWKLNYSRYFLTDFDYTEIVRLIRRGKEYLENHLCLHSSNYSCIGFRAGNWNTQPSWKYLRALKEAGIESDTSVFKWGLLNTVSVNIDYRKAYSNILPWIACWENINNIGISGGILEFPIYSEAVSLIDFLKFKRMKNAIRYLREDREVSMAVKKLSTKKNYEHFGLINKIGKIIRKYPKKFDFCKLNTREMAHMLNNIHNCFRESAILSNIPIVMIGHSKDISSCDDIKALLRLIEKKYNGIFMYSTYLEAIKRHIK